MTEAGKIPQQPHDEQATPLFVSFLEGQMGAVKLLLLAKADPLLAFARQQSEDTTLPMEMAVMNVHSEVVHELVSSLESKAAPVSLRCPCARGLRPGAACGDHRFVDGGRNGRHGPSPACRLHQ